MDDRLRDFLPDTEGLAESVIREKFPQYPRIYDMGTDSHRFATQSDIDGLISIARHYAEISEIVRHRRASLGLAD